MRGCLFLLLALALPLTLALTNQPTGFSASRRECSASIDENNSSMAKVALVTGATGQIGRAIAVEIARAGYKTLLTCRDEGRGQKLVSEISKESGGGNVVLAPVVDLSSVASVSQMTRALSKEYPSLHLLVNNAVRGISPCEAAAHASIYPRYVASTLKKAVNAGWRLMPIVNIHNNTQAIVEKSRVLTKEGLETQFAVNVHALPASPHGSCLDNIRRPCTSPSTPSTMSSLTCKSTSELSTPFK